MLGRTSLRWTFGGFVNSVIGELPKSPLPYIARMGLGKVRW